MSKRTPKRLAISDQGTGVLEIIQHPEYGDNVCGIFRYANETHTCLETGDGYDVRIYSSVLKVTENNDQLKQGLACATHNMLFPEIGDTVFVKGEVHGLSDDILIYHDRHEHFVMWFTVEQAKSYFGPHYDSLFAHIEQLPWGAGVANG